MSLLPNIKSVDTRNIMDLTKRKQNLAKMSMTTNDELSLDLGQPQAFVYSNQMKKIEKVENTLNVTKQLTNMGDSQGLRRDATDMPSIISNQPMHSRMNLHYAPMDGEPLVVSKETFDQN